LSDDGRVEGKKRRKTIQQIISSFQVIIITPYVFMWKIEKQILTELLFHTKKKKGSEKKDC